MTIRLIPLMLLPVVALSAGCGPNCQNTCNKIYQPSECNIERAGRTQDQLIDRCLEECEGALNDPGDLGSYDPQNQRGSADEFPLETDHQAAAWMDCVDATACENLQKEFLSADLVTVKALALLAPLLAAFLGGCEPTCQETCNKLLDCDDVDTPRLSLEECETSCKNTENLYESWDDDGKRDKLGDMKRCIADEDCSDIADGVCYDSDLVIW